MAAKQAFSPVWYLPAENTWQNFNPLAYRKRGRLILNGDELIFESQTGRLVLRQIRSISLGKQGRDFINTWIKVESGSGEPYDVAYFADGSWLGWGGVFGGTLRLLRAIKTFIGEDLTTKTRRSTLRAQN